MYNYGIHGVPCCSQMVCKLYTYNTVSTLRDVNYGVPQGSVLGPLLFLLYVNDILHAVPNERLKLFADDTNLFLSGIDTAEIKHQRL